MRRKVVGCNVKWVRIVAKVWSAVILAGCLLCAQAETIYKAPGDSGPVYSDAPTPGSREINLPPPNIVQPPPKLPPAPQEIATEKVPAQAERYRIFHIIQPEDGGSVAATTTAFEVRVAVEPPLQTEFGHAFTLKLNGKAVSKRYLFPEMLIPPEFFGDTIRVPQQFLIEVNIVDSRGKVLLTAQPVEATMRDVLLPLPRRLESIIKKN